MRRFAAAAALAALALAQGCAKLSVRSEPAGAQLLWSPNGLEPFRPWPPTGDGREGNTATPHSEFTTTRDVFFMTVEKEGYRRPLAKLVQLAPLRTARLSFDLEKLPEYEGGLPVRDGLVLYQGEWVDPAAAGLAVHEGRLLGIEQVRAKERLAQGLVEFEGRDVAPAERDRLWAERQRAEGRTLFKERWLLPEEIAAEEAVDRAAAEINTLDGLADLDAPRVLGRVESAFAQLQLFNNTALPVRVLLSGPSSRELRLEPFGSFGGGPGEALYVVAGRYQVVYLPLENDGLPAAPESSATRSAAGAEGRTAGARTAITSQPLASGFRYSFNYSGGDRLRLEDLRQYEPPQVQLPVERQEIEVPEAPAAPAPPAEAQRGNPSGGGRPPGGRPPGGGRPRP
ncbi:MAG: hypothetical protein SF028_14700 [Candidatus Sumerlaeia bacterium]|nr:hypothetical protein [Candidatus Sumerlaeia bacterium]